jgi:hypothetical protein
LRKSKYFFLLNDFDLFKLKRHYKSLFEKNIFKKIFKYNNFFDSYDNIYEFDLFDSRYSLNDYIY